jgi:YHS domain-containing protein
VEPLAYFLLWAAAIFLMMRFGCGAHVMGHGHHHHHDGERAGGTPGAGQSTGTPTTAVDPVCGMTVQTATAKSSARDGGVYYFCSAVHPDEFEANPTRYASRTADMPPQTEQAHA